MRTANSTAALPRHLHWQAAFSIKHYCPLTPLVWHHTFVSNARMTNWRGGSDLILCWVRHGNPERQAELASGAGVGKNSCRSS
jgi:hypothetical protein